MPMPATVLGIFDKDNKELNYGEIGELCMTGPSIMLHYAGWMGEEMTERTLITHDDGKCWLHTGDIAYIKETGMVYILGRGHQNVSARRIIYDENGNKSRSRSWRTGWFLLYRTG